VAFRGDEDIKERIVTQLEKLHDVKEVEVLDQSETVVRELLLLKIQNRAETRQDIMTAVEIFRSKIVDYSAEAMICELTGESAKIDAFIALMRPYGIMEMCRTGIVAIERGNNCLRTLHKHSL
jgi:acetolactate synthase-1/3 small subunit